MDHKFDMQGFAAQLAKTLGGRHEGPPERIDLSAVAYVFIGDVRLVLRHGYANKTDGVTVYGGSKYDDALRKADSYHALPKYPEATVNSTRDLKALVNDITRRVIVPSSDKAKETREKLRKAHARLANLDRTMDELRKRYPQATIEKRSGNDHEGYISHPGHYGLNARIQGNDTVYMDGLGSMPMERYALVVHAMTCELPEKK